MLTTDVLISVRLASTERLIYPASLATHPVLSAQAQLPTNVPLVMPVNPSIQIINALRSVQLMNTELPIYLASLAAHLALNALEEVPLNVLLALLIKN